MDTLDIFSTQRVRYRGKYSFEDLYEAIYEYFDTKRYDAFEKKYAKSGDDKVDLEVEGQKEINALIRRRIVIEITAFDMQEFIVSTSQGRKKMTEGRLIITLTGYCDIDYRNIFGEDGRLGSLGPSLYKVLKGNIFKKYFGPNYYAPVYKDTAKLRGKLNGVLNR